MLMKITNIVIYLAKYHKAILLSQPESVIFKKRFISGISYNTYFEL